MEGEAKTVIEQIEAIKDTDEFKTLVSNEAKNYIGGELKTVYNSFDSVVKDTLGLEKPSDIKSTEWVQKNLSKVVELEKELEALKGQSDNSEATKKLYEDKLAQKDELLTQKDNQLKELSQKGFEDNLKNQIDHYLIDKTFLATYRPEDIKVLVGAKKQQIISNTKELDNGKIAVLNPETGKYYLDTLGEPLTPVQVAEIMFQGMFVSKTPGGSADPNNQPLGAKGDALNMSDVINDIKTQGQFFAEFAKIAPKGLKSHDEKYLKIQRATIEHYKINALPLD
jgi:hypothetical protein